MNNNNEILTTDTIVNILSEEQLVPHVQSIIPAKVFHTEVNEDTFHDILASVIITSVTKVLENPALVNRVHNSLNIPMLSDGAIATCAGKAKSGKTQLALSIAAAYLAKNNDNRILEAANLHNGYLVTYVDTEQAISEAQKSFEKINRMVGCIKAMESLRYMALQILPYKQRLIFLEKYLYENRDQIKILILDGVRDFIADPNNMEESLMIVSYLIKWCHELNIAILCIIHQNKGDNHLRGFLGTELQNKSSNVFSVEKDADVFVVTSMLSRGRPFQPFAFSLDEEGTPVNFHEHVAKAKQAESKNLDSITDELHLDALAKIYKDVTVLPGWGDFMRLLKKALAEKSISAGDVKLRSFVSLYLQKGWLVKEPVEGRSYGGYRYVSPTG